MVVESEPFVILVADRDATVGVISSMLLSSALAIEHESFFARVRVLVEPEIISVIEKPELPEEVRKIEEQVMSATRADIEHANLVVAFSGLDVRKLHELRERGIPAPAVNLCQFVANLEKLIHNLASARVNVRDVIVNAALQFGFGGGSSTCEICAMQERESFNYWINIADTCSKFAQIVRKI